MLFTNLHIDINFVISLVVDMVHRCSTYLVGSLVWCQQHSINPFPVMTMVTDEDEPLSFNLQSEAGVTLCGLVPMVSFCDLCDVTT